MKNIYKQRLLAFANHLSKIKNHYAKGIVETVFFVELDEKSNIPNEIQFNYWVFEELPVCFDEWYFEGRCGSPAWEGLNEEEGTVACVISFFNLNLQDFVYLFNIAEFKSVSRVEGEKVTEESDGIAIAKNILSLIEAGK